MLFFSRSRRASKGNADHVWLSFLINEIRIIPLPTIITFVQSLIFEETMVRYGEQEDINIKRGVR